MWDPARHETRLTLRRRRRPQSRRGVPSGAGDRHSDQLGIPDLLTDSPMSSEELAGAVSVDAAALYRVLGPSPTETC